MSDLPSPCYLIVRSDTDLPPFWIGVDNSNRLSYYTEDYAMRITVDQHLPFLVNPLTDRGRAAVIDGEVKFTSSNPSIAAVESTGPQSGVVKPAGTSTASGTNTSRDILLKGSPTNVTFPTESTFN